MPVNRHRETGTSYRPATGFLSPGTSHECLVTGVGSPGCQATASASRRWREQPAPVACLQLRGPGVASATDLRCCVPSLASSSEVRVCISNQRQGRASASGLNHRSQSPGLTPPFTPPFAPGVDSPVCPRLLVPALAIGSCLWSPNPGSAHSFRSWHLGLRFGCEINLPFRTRLLALGVETNHRA